MKAKVLSSIVIILFFLLLYCLVLAGLDVGERGIQDWASLITTVFFSYVGGIFLAVNIIKWIVK